MNYKILRQRPLPYSDLYSKLLSFAFIPVYTCEMDEARLKRHVRTKLQLYCVWEEVY